MSRQRFTSRKRRARDTLAAEINVGTTNLVSLDQLWTESAKLNSGNGGTGFPDGQIFTGIQFLYDSAAQESDFVWIQDSSLFKLGGYIVLDYDINSGIDPTPDDIVAVFGMTEAPTQPGTKNAGLLFNQPTYPAVIASNYDGPILFQKLNITHTNLGPEFHWPILDGPAGGSLSTNSSGGLYWTPPANPPELIEDTDTTVYAVFEFPGNLAPVTVTATRLAAPGQVAFECTFSTISQNRTVVVELLVDGVQTGQIYTTPLPRGVDTFVHHTWSVLLPNGNEVLTIRHVANNTDVEVFGNVTDTVLSLLIPSSALLAQREQTPYIIDSFSFMSRFTNTEKENWSKGQRGEKWQPGPFPADLLVWDLDTLKIQLASNNVNLFQSHVVDGVNLLESEGIIGPR